MESPLWFSTIVHELYQKVSSWSTQNYYVAFNEGKKIVDQGLPLVFIMSSLTLVGVWVWIWISLLQHFTEIVHINSFQADRFLLHLNNPSSLLSAVVIDEQMKKMVRFSMWWYISRQSCQEFFTPGAEI